MAHGKVDRFLTFQYIGCFQCHINFNSPMRTQTLEKFQLPFSVFWISGTFQFGPPVGLAGVFQKKLFPPFNTYDANLLQQRDIMQLFGYPV